MPVVARRRSSFWATTSTAARTAPIRTLMGLQSRPRTRVIALRGNVRQRRTGSVGIISRRNEFLLPGDLTLELIGVTRYCVNPSHGDSQGSPTAVGAAPRANIRSRFRNRMPVKNRSAKSSGKSVSPLPLRSVRPRELILRKPGAEKPQAAKLPVRATAVRLAAEVERLAAELEASRARITELETRIDVDPLTEALNRRGFERELRRSLAYVKRYGATAAVISLDLDEFKPINDRYGRGRRRCSKRSRRRSRATCALPTWSRVLTATSSSCFFGT